MPQHHLLSTVLTLAAITTITNIGLPKVSYAADHSARLINSQPARLIAQSAASTEGDGNLSVTGTSQINAAADQAVLVLAYYPNSYYSVDSSDPNAASQALQVKPSDLKAVMDALTAAGIPANNVKAFADPNSPGSMRVRIVVDQPTQSRIEQIMNAVNTAVEKTNRFIASGALAGYTIKDCQAVESQVRQAAMADAKDRAAALANVAGTQIGKVVSLSESISWGSGYTAVCPASSDPDAYYDSTALPAYDPAVPPAIHVLYSLSVIYGMR